ncbi:MAG: OpgC domain-containing protein [Pseudomonadota bacterium]
MTADSPMDIRSHANQAATRAVSQPHARVRDPRLDFFRGIAMFIILIAHVPSNWLTLWIPARFGFSDATEIFVFCSGMASAIAFGAVFRERGWWMGTARVAYRTWQVYWAHICLFLAILVTMAALNMLLPDGRDYVGQLNLYPFIRNTEVNLIGLITLTYVPNYFDILPMYLVILVMIPLMVALARVHVALAFGASFALWAAVQIWGFNLPAEPWSERGWFFNPFGWQLVFFTGFALMFGWLPAPPVNRLLFWSAAALVVLIVPFAYFRIYTEVPALLELRREFSWLIDKTDFGFLRYVHFLAAAYVAWVWVGEKGANIQPGDQEGPLSYLWRVVLAAIMKVGQQSLAVFIASMFLARMLGVIFDQVGRDHFSMAWVNALGVACIIAVAYGAGWFKSQPWRKQRAAGA